MHFYSSGPQRQQVGLTSLTAPAFASSVCLMRTQLVKIWKKLQQQRVPALPGYFGVVALGGALVFALVPLFWLLGASLPQADDTCLARHLHSTSLWGVGEFIYFNWSGRVLSHWLMALPGWAAVQNLLPFATALQVGNFVMLVVLLLTMVLACRQLLGTWRLGSLAGVLLLAWWAWHLISPVDAFYWYSATAAYTMILPLTLGMLGGLLGLLSRHVAVQVGAWGLAVLMGVALTSMHELSAILALGLSLMTLAYLWWWRLPKRSLALAGGLVAAVVVGLLITFLAPGNAVRISASGTGQSLLVALVGGLPIGLGWVLAQLNVALAVWLAAWAVLVQRVRPKSASVLWPLAAWLGVGLVGLVVLAPAMGLMANGESLPPRAENILHFWLVWGLMLLVGWAVQRYGLPRLLVRYQHSVLLALAVVIVASPTWVRAVNDTRRVPGLQAAYAQREALLQQAAVAQQPVVVPPLPNIPKTAYRETLQPNPTAWQNTCAAEWYRVPQVTLQP